MGGVNTIIVNPLLLGRKYCVTSALLVLHSLLVETCIALESFLKVTESHGTVRHCDGARKSAWQKSSSNAYPNNFVILFRLVWVKFSYNTLISRLRLVLHSCFCSKTMSPENILLLLVVTSLSVATTLAQGTCLCQLFFNAQISIHYQLYDSSIGYKPILSFLCITSIPLSLLVLFQFRSGICHWFRTTSSDQLYQCFHILNFLFNFLRLPKAVMHPGEEPQAIHKRA